VLFAIVTPHSDVFSSRPSMYSAPPQPPLPGLPSVPVAALPDSVVLMSVRSPLRLPTAPPSLAELFVNVLPTITVSPPPKP